MHNVNVLLFTYVNNFAGQSKFFDTLFVFITNYLAYIVVGIVIGYFFIKEFRDKKTLPDTLHHTSHFFYLCVSFLTTWVVVELIKAFVAHPRPFQIISSLTVLAPFGSLDSFPSAHTALTTAIGTSVFFLNKHLGYVLLLFALVVGFSRIYVGVHFPIDVLFGVVIGASIPRFFFIFLYKNKKNKSQ